MENTDKKHIIGITYKQVDHKGWLRLDEWQYSDRDCSAYEWVSVSDSSDKSVCHIYKPGDWQECACCNLGHSHSEAEHLAEVSKNYKLH